ncbi:hypothetical protein SeMB42_g04343 [Synchytrium endobioticum]|uniref:Uncharacterized protein n=1 Tax=Synchytrium endobioticum TaxID=286115 RepID=A0A507CZ18_9FUNG|nr:hypothetical protein SeMB42_g04343 [Synchytrium endobioticum]TPX49187.1 hypothetical protein SeLEV6574_g01623 [Synchytrium endobioticum]
MNRQVALLFKRRPLVESHRYVRSYSTPDSATERQPSPIFQSEARHQTEIVYSTLHRLRRSAWPLILWLTLASITLELRWARYDYLEYRKDVAARTRHLQAEMQQWKSKALGTDREVLNDCQTASASTGPVAEIAHAPVLAVPSKLGVSATESSKPILY